MSMKKLFLIAIAALGMLACTPKNNPDAPEQNDPETPTEEQIVKDSLFSVSDNTQVQFSKGNLQYQASTGIWRFAEHQYEYMGETNAHISTLYSGWIDLFGWGTGANPSKVSEDPLDYSTFVDWGTNTISNSGNSFGKWRTLTKDEWDYLFNTRTNADSLYGMGCVNGVNGLIVLPDNWKLPRKESGLSFVSRASNESFNANAYTVAQWQVMENTGAVFLPAAGMREGTTLSYLGWDGHYWSTTEKDTYNSYYVSFSSMHFGAENPCARCLGCSVRLVR